MDFRLNNKKFYDCSGPSWLRDLAKAKGLEAYSDFEAIREKLIGANHILEFGCGRGRLVSWLIENNCKQNYTGVDFSLESIRACENNYMNHLNLKFICSDICKLSLSENKYDLIIWPWSGVLELDHQDKLIALESAKKLLSNKGSLFIDMTLEILGDKKVVIQNDGLVEQHSDFGFVRNRLISIAQLRQFCRQSGLVTSSSVNYLTTHNYPRIWLEFKATGIYKDE